MFSIKATSVTPFHFIVLLPPFSLQICQALANWQIPRQANTTLIVKSFPDEQKKSKTNILFYQSINQLLTSCFIVFAAIILRKKNYFVLSSLSSMLQYFAYHVKIFCMSASQKGHKCSIWWLVASRWFVLI